jgi:hypothetical protein
MSDAQQEPCAPGPGPYQGGPYPPPPYGYGGYGGYPYPPQPGTNTMAILALVLAFVCAPAAIVLGVLARKQIRRTGEQGWGLATAGFVCGIVFTALSLIGIVVMILLFVTATRELNDANNSAVLLHAAQAYFGF